MELRLFTKFLSDSRPEHGRAVRKRVALDQVVVASRRSRSHHGREPCEARDAQNLCLDASSAVDKHNKESYPLYSGGYYSANR